MYIWRIDRLKTQLAAGPLTDREILPYAMTNGVLMGIAFTLPPEHPSVWDSVSGLVAAAAAIAGTIWAYTQNGGMAGTNFLQRYVSICWVVTIRFFVALLGAIALWSMQADPIDPEGQTTWRGVALYALVCVVFYQRVGVHIRHVARSAK